MACGTGVVARTAADRMGGRGRVAGADRNEGMLAVARRLRPDPEWHRADAADLPFEDGSFDAVLCQSALMFFPDRVGAFARHLGPEAAEVGGAYWALGDLELLGSLFEAAGLEVTGTRTRVGTVRFGSAAEAVATEIEATPLAARVDPGTHRRLVDAGVQALARFVVDGGRVELPISGHLVTAVAPG